MNNLSGRQGMRHRAQESGWRCKRYFYEEERVSGKTGVAEGAVITEFSAGNEA
jgi:hypothetical protein